MGILFTITMGFLLTIGIVFLFTITMGFLFTIVLGIQLTISKRLALDKVALVAVIYTLVRGQKLLLTPMAFLHHETESHSNTSFFSGEASDSEAVHEDNFSAVVRGACGGRS